MDWACVRAVLSAIEADEAHSADGGGRFVRFTEGEVAGHFRLLSEGRLVEGDTASHGSARLTFAGHEMLAILDAPELWRAIKIRCRYQGVPLSYEAIRILAADEIHHRTKG